MAFLGRRKFNVLTRGSLSRLPLWEVWIRIGDAQAAAKSLTWSAPRCEACDHRVSQSAPALTRHAATSNELRMRWAN